ncbi:hypothetical protein RJ639_011425 [Escallonia herrerae]|uniref:Uncharacterized protein n=1 Tax=Escallonia herrerae TaxID=1293975 RepID=A0AA88VN89_9ASTE|nr:hypothetical protein RJ639_011425 [Escallonia herrerae]
MHSLCSLIRGSPAAKVYSKLRAVTARAAERKILKPLRYFTQKWKTTSYHHHPIAIENNPTLFHHCHPNAIGTYGSAPPSPPTTVGNQPN